MLVGMDNIERYDAAVNSGAEDGEAGA